MNYETYQNLPKRLQKAMEPQHSSVQTENRIKAFEKAGFKIIEGNNPYMDQAAKYANMTLVRLCQTNSRCHGRSIKTVWAVKK